MNLLEAIILGAIQGLAEFLPISSSGHLILAREIMGISQDANFLFFDIMLHVATLFAILIVLFKDIVELFKPPFKTLALVALASIPAVITGVLYSVLDLDVYITAKYLCFFFLVSSALMFFAEFIGKRIYKNKALADGAVGGVKSDGEETVGDVKKITYKNALAMGLMQAGAVFPGVTRSGSTIFGGIVSKGERNSVAKFSFFMSVPIILGAACFELIGDKTGVINVSFACYAAGMITAFITGFLSIKFMLRLIGKANFKWFSLYLLILGIVTFFGYFLGYF